MDAPWKTDLTMWWGRDAEGAARGFSWCGLCGTDCPVGVVVRGKDGTGREGSAFFCPECCRRMHIASLVQLPEAKA